jgi:hypothetical protein
MGAQGALLPPKHSRKRTSSFAAAVLAAPPPPSFRNPKMAMGLTGAALLVPALAPKSCWPAGLAEKLTCIRQRRTAPLPGGGRGL